MESLIPKYNFKFKTNFPTGEKKYISTYVKHMISEFVYDMGNLENNPFTFPEVQTLLEGITVGGHKLSDQTQILNIKASWDYITSFMAKSNITIDKELICSIHKIVAKDEALIVGDFRNGNIGIAGTLNYKCIPAKNLNEVFSKDLTTINQIENPLEKAIILNLWLSYCQFFYDGNKRTARLSSNLITLTEGIGVISIPARYKFEYNSLMFEFYVTKYADKIIEFILEKCMIFFDNYDYKTYSEI